MCSLFFRVLQATGVLREMSLKDVDCGTVFDHLCHYNSTCCIFDVEEEGNVIKGPRPVSDRHVFIQLKIIIGFYQVTHGLLTVFSYIEWPESLHVVSTYSGILQMNLLQIAPIHCLSSGLRVNVFGELLLILTVNVTAIGVTGFGYIVFKTIIVKNHNLNDKEKSTKISETKRLFCKNLFFFLYVTYLGTFSKTVSVLPLACRKVCRDDEDDV